MASRTTTWCLLLCAVLALSVTSCDFTSDLTFRNVTGQTLTPYPVVTTPPPPHREADSAANISPGGTASIDPLGFNPVYYAAGITDPTQANGVYLGLDLDDAAPFMIQFKVFHYRVPPGQAGHDPDKQPILLHTGVQEIIDVDHTITVSRFPIAGEPLPPGGWSVRINPD